MTQLPAVFERLDALTRNMPREIQMIATNLGWGPHINDFAISERIVASEMPSLPKTLRAGNLHDGPDLPALEEYVYERTTLKMSQVMDVVNPYGYYNFFGSTTVKSNSAVFLRIAQIFQQAAKDRKNNSALDEPASPRVMGSQNHHTRASHRKMAL